VKSGFVEVVVYFQTMADSVLIIDDERGIRETLRSLPCTE
jgi:hypothetical protein